MTDIVSDMKASGATHFTFNQTRCQEQQDYIVKGLTKRGFKHIPSKTGKNTVKKLTYGKIITTVNRKTKIELIKP